MTPREAEIIGLVKKEVKPALGCTEPIAVALAAAKATEILTGQCPCSREWMEEPGFGILVEVSGNILKNGMGVGIPGTGMVGLHIAAALGVVCGKSEYGLEVLHDLCDGAVEKAKRLVSEGRVQVRHTETGHKLFAKVTVTCDGDHKASASVEDDHDNIVETSFDGNILHRSHSGTCGDEGTHKTTLDYRLTLKEIFDFATTVSFNDIRFILEARDMNLRLAREGLSGDYGLKVGKTINSGHYREVFGNDFMSYAMALTAAASDARMAGCTLPAMSNSGSGNQGITVTMPVVAYGIKYGTPDEQLARALILSHLAAIHIKGYLGKLSALCGCVIASTGAACGITFLRGGDYRHVCAAVKNMIGNITGMVCDGAKVGCAMKVASGVSSAIQSAVLAMEGTCISEHDGIIEKDIEKTIQNLGKIGSVGMQNADSMILDIMVCK